MSLSAPVSLALLHDLRVRPLTWAERGVLHHLSLLAGLSPDGATVPIDHRAGEADVAAWTRALGAEGAQLVGRLVEMGLLARCPEGLRVAFVAHAAAQAAVESDSWDGGPFEWQGKPSASPVAQRARNDRALFGKRVKGWGHIPPGVTWEQWVVTAEGEAFVVARESVPRFAGYRAWVTPRGNAGNTQGVTPGVTPQGNTPLARASDSQNSPSFQGESEKKRGTQTREGTAGVTPQGNTGGNTTRVTPPASALDALRDASAGHATLTGATALEREAAEVLSRHTLTETDLARAAAAFADPSAWWPRGKNPAPKHVTLNDLAGFCGERGYEWRALAALVAHLRQRKAVRRFPPVAPAEPPVAPPLPPPRATSADARRALAAIKTPSAPPPPLETPDA